jgi:hypothetical protein
LQPQEPQRPQQTGSSLPASSQLEERINEEQKALESDLTLRLEAAQRLLNQDKAELVSLEERIKAGKERLQMSSDEYKATQTKLALEVAEKKLQLKDLDADIFDLRSSKAKARDELKAVESLLREIKKEVKDTREEIRDRRAYLNQQEESIQIALENGNSDLLAKRGEINQAMSSKEALLRDILVLEQEKSQAVQEGEVTTAQLEQLHVRYNDTAANYRASLGELQQDIVVASSNLRDTNLEVQSRLELASVREQELEAKAHELEAKEAELLKRELRFQSNSQIYNIG